MIDETPVEQPPVETAPLQVLDTQTAQTIVNQLRDEVARVKTKTANNEAAMIVVLNGWGQYVASIQQRLNSLNSEGAITADARRELTELLDGLTTKFNGIKYIGIGDLHAMIVETPAGVTPQQAAADPANSLVEALQYHQVNAMNDGSVSSPTIETTAAGEAETARRAAAPTDDTDTPTPITPVGEKRRR